MKNMPQYLGPMAFGIKMGVIVPGMNLSEEIFKVLDICNKDDLLDNGDTICITESIVARAQNNFVTVDDVSREVREKLSLSSDGKVGVVFPITSRNRFAQVLSGIAGAVPRGEVVIQLSFPCDEVGNQLIDPDIIKGLGKADNEIIKESEIEGHDFKHPITGVNYISLYQDVVRETGAKPTVILSNDPLAITTMSVDGVIAADIHTREKTASTIKKVNSNCVTLQDICCSGKSWSEWGLLGSNLSSGNKIKLAPREGEQLVTYLQSRVFEELGKKIEVLIYGDGAYKDPSSGIYELADPQPVFAATGGLDCYREGVKYKFLADQYLNEGKNVEEIEKLMEDKKKEVISQDKIESEGTTPRKIGDLLASLADLVSGSADAGTPVVLIKGFLK